MGIDPRIHEQAVAIERVHFVKTDRKVNPKKVDPFCYLPGTHPILVTAPRSVRYQVKKSIKPSHEFTGAFTYLLHQLAGCSMLAVSKFYGGDPDRDFPCIFKEKIAQICAEKKIKLVLDFQGTGRTTEYDLQLETNSADAHSPSQKLAAVLARVCEERGLTVGIIPGKKEPPHTVLGFVAEELGLPAVRLLLNRKLRVPHQNGKDFHKALGALVEALARLANF